MQLQWEIKIKKLSRKLVHFNRLCLQFRAAPAMAILTPHTPSFIPFLTIMLLFVPFSATVPQVFTESYTFCEYSFIGRKHPITFPDKVWTVATRDFTLHFSLCKSVHAACRNQTSACLIRKTDNQLIDLGREFAPVVSDDLGLVSNGAKCAADPAKRHTLSLSLQCSDAIKAKPRLMLSENECGFEVSMMAPDCRPKCTEVMANAYVLDIRSFAKNIPVAADSKKFSLSLCGSNTVCLQDTSACEVLPTKVVPLAQVDSQYLNYDAASNELTARGRYKDGRVVRDVEVLIKCNWETDLTNVTYKKVQTQGKHYKFELESSFGCVKLPHSCALSSIDNLNYDLEKLYKVDGWRVSGVPQGQVVVNICGALKHPLNTVCSAQYSQICHRINTNYLNRGSILSSLKAYDEFIKAVFVSGSTCKEAPHTMYSTEIELRCSKTEKGPVFKQYNGCMMMLTWETPHACPIDYYKGQNCYINDRLSNRNLQKIYSQNDKTYPLSPDLRSKLVYNLCGPIHDTCDSFGNVSFCLKTEGRKDSVIGWDRRELISDGGFLRMELSGDACANGRSRGEVVVNFICNYEDPAPAHQINVIEDGCRYNLTIFTPLACISLHKFDDCVYNTEDTCYDLSPLADKRKNYVIPGDGNTEYIFNLCGPIVSGPEALCRGDTMVCLRNKTAVNIKHRFTSLGGIGTPRLVNNSLVVETHMGATFCEGFSYYKTAIHFECSQKKLAPVFVSKEPCVYHFLWKTPEACPQTRKCIISGSKPDMVLDLTNLQTKIMNINVDNTTNKYEFHLCKDVYTKSSNSVVTTDVLKREFVNYNRDSFLILDLEKDCNNVSSLSKVIIKLECSRTTDDHFQETSFEGCVLNMTLHARSACPLAKEKHVSYSLIEESETSSQSPTSPRREVATATPQEVKHKNCTLINGHTGYEFNLSKINSDELFFGNSNFTVNAGCDGILCKNNVKMVPIMCPVATFNYTHRSVKLQYSTHTECAPQMSYELEIHLKCNETRSRGKVTEDRLCSSVIVYELPEACSLLKNDVVVATVPTAAIAGIVTTLVVLLGMAVLTYLHRRRGRYLPFQTDKANVRVYTRDSTL